MAGRFGGIPQQLYCNFLWNGLPPYEPETWWTRFWLDCIIREAGLSAEEDQKRDILYRKFKKQNPKGTSDRVIWDMVYDEMPVEPPSSVPFLVPPPDEDAPGDNEFIELPDGTKVHVSKYRR